MSETNIEQIMKFVTTTIEAGASSQGGAVVKPQAIQAFLDKYQPRFDARFKLKEVGVPGWQAARENIRRAAAAHGVISGALAGLSAPAGSAPQVTTDILMEMAAPLIESQCNARDLALGPWCSGR